MVWTSEVQGNIGASENIPQMEQAQTSAGREQQQIQMIIQVGPSAKAYRTDTDMLIV